MKFSAEQIAGIINGTVDGNPSVEVNTLAKIEEGTTGALSFLANPKYEEHIYKTDSSVCIVNNTFKPANPLPDSLTLIKVDDAYTCFAKLLEFYDTLKKEEPRIEVNSFIDDTAVIGDNIYVGASSYIGKETVIGDDVAIHPNVTIGPNVTVGDGTVIYPGATIYRDCVIGKNCIIHSGAVIGADGFGFAPNEKGEFQKIPQIGNVILEDYVDIGANSTIDRATMGSTIIRKGAKIDNLVQIGHNVEVGNNVLIGGQVGMAGHLKIGDRVKIAAQSGIGGNVKEDTKVMGSPAFDSDDYKKSYLGFRRLPMILTRLKAIEDTIKKLTKDH
jgi:UDP-3-O-[3-hydroxymyristoyl] glucosamine N-acyltransferase